jgi:hypothetical protein
MPDMLQPAEQERSFLPRETLPLPVKSMTSDTKEPHATKDDNDEEIVPAPANSGSVSSSSSAGPAPQSEAPEESVPGKRRPTSRTVARRLRSIYPRIDRASGSRKSYLTRPVSRKGLHSLKGG